MLSVCVREVQKSLAQSSKRLIEGKLSDFGLGSSDGFKVFNDCIETPGDGLIAFQGMQDHTAESIKSLEGFKRAWVEEAQGLSQRSLTLLRPTIRAPGSELWFSWNRRRKTDPVDVLLTQGSPPTGAVVVVANWRDNPWFPPELEQERLDDQRDRPDQYDHIWEGDYEKVTEGAYYAAALSLAKQEDRIGFVARDPNMQVRTFWDLGRRDATAIWVAQWIGQKINVIDYIEGANQPPAFYFEQLRERGYRGAMVYLPHDGSRVGPENSSGRSYEDQARDAGFDVRVILNQGAGAAMLRIDAARRLFPRMWFNAATTEGGRDALGAYHERQDEKRNIGLGPEHDWSSHGCFHGDTQILTRYGLRRIKELPFQGEVLTPCGWKPYAAPRITKMDAPLVEVGFVGGHTVRCTPDHLFLTDSGWRSAESLRPGSLIQSSLTRSRSISMAVSTAFGRAKRTTLAAARSFIDTSGRTLSALSRGAAIFTIATAIPQTTPCPTLSAWTAASTSRTRGGKPRRRSKNTSRRPLATLPRTGIDLRRAGSGTSDTPSAARAGRNGSASRALAPIARSSSIVSSALTATVKSTAAQLVRLLRTGLAERPTSTLLRIAHVRPLSETADVWDITVPDGHWFSLANGAVVHNSDAFGLMAVAYEEPRIKRARQPVAAGGWMGR